MTPTHLIGSNYCLPIPEVTENIEICNYGLNDALEYDHEGVHEVTDLPPGNWEIICTTKEAIRTQPEGLVELYTAIQGYRNYQDAGAICCRYEDSLRSLLTSKGLDVNKNYVLIKKAS